MKQFLTLASASDDELEAIFAEAVRLAEKPRRRDLEGHVLGMLFMNPSVRTLASFQAGMAQLGGSSFIINPGQGSWSMEWRPNVVMDGVAAEHLREAIPVLASYADALAVRAFGEGKSLAEDCQEPLLTAVAARCEKPFINLESALDHPCQALGDWMTLDHEQVPRRGGRIVLTWAQHPKALPLAVPVAVARMAARRGMDLTVLAPEGFALPEDILASACKEAERRGGSIRQTSRHDEALAGAQVIYAKSWQAPSAYGDVDRETRLRQALPRRWTVDESWFETTDKNALFMHCLPVRRGVVVADSVLDGPRSRVVQQANFRLHAQKALLLSLFGKL
ncbi:MAG: N-acetylornithine carbamoyltransferase [Planctomycetes bacterium]|nr:N-acetylornithine carbamoyltransferase [Planctomycetota bacterium]